jgi:hypothetical protein
MIFVILMMYSLVWAQVSVTLPAIKTDVPDVSFDIDVEKGFAYFGGLAMFLDSYDTSLPAGTVKCSLNSADG